MQSLIVRAAIVFTVRAYTSVRITFDNIVYTTRGDGDLQMGKENYHFMLQMLMENSWYSV